jgi:mannose-6-phosphate isomerase-like protein (cupin superfamily)
MGTGADDVRGTASLLRPGGLDGNRAEGFNHNLIQFRSAVRAIAISGKLFIAQGDNHQGYGPTRIDKSTTRHPASEQIWVALEGSGILLLDDERTEPFVAGDVVRFADGDLHGFRNPGDAPFIYLSVTAPPVNFREAYSKDWSKAGPARAAMQNRP